MHLLQPAEGTCPTCAVEHVATNPHNCQSMYYQMRFYGLRRRWPTWADALAHCSENVRAAWKERLEDMGVWSEPADGDPIADPPAESLSELVDMGIKPTVVEL